MMEMPWNIECDLPVVGTRSKADVWDEGKVSNGLRVAGKCVDTFMFLPKLYAVVSRP